MTKTPSKRAPAPAILVPTDGSSASLRALDWAIRVASASGSTIHLMSVARPLDDYGMVAGYLTAKSHREKSAEHIAGILAPALKRLEKSGVAHEKHVIWGEPADAIARTAARLRCGWIIMGTRGLGSAAGLLLGSTATKVVHKAKVPVTLVK